MSWIHVASIFFFLTTGGLLFAAERLRGTPMSRYAAMSSLGSIVIAGVLFCMDVPNMGPLMDPWEVAKGPKKEKVHEEGEDEDGEEGGNVKVVQAKAKGIANPNVSPEAMKKAQIVRECELIPEMVSIPAGNGVIGAEAGDKTATPYEKPAREVRVWPGFQISKYEISTFEYKCFLTATKRVWRRCSGMAPVPELLSKFDPREAATCITWEDAQAYVAWLSVRSGTQYSLPTATQWEYASRAGNQPLVLIAESRRKRNAWHAHDMGGGVAELTNSCWEERPANGADEPEAEPEDPSECGAHILKDGAETEEPRFQQHWSRRKMPATKATTTVGFRIVRRGN